jgi:hypothetical protein
MESRLISAKIRLAATMASRLKQLFRWAEQIKERRIATLFRVQAEFQCFIAVYAARTHPSKAMRP